MSLSDLPMDAVDAILGFVPDARSIFRFACTCHEYAVLVTENEALWRKVYRHHWKRGRLPIQQSPWRTSCVVRCQNDALAALYVNRMASGMMRRAAKLRAASHCRRSPLEEAAGAALHHGCDGSLRSVAAVWDPDSSSWSSLMNLGVNVLEACLKMHEDVVSDLLTASFREKCTAYVAAMAAYHLELANCFTECYGLYQNPFVDDDELMEQYAILITVSHLTMDEFLEANGGAAIERHLTLDLDVIASTLLKRLDGAGISTTDSPCLAVDELCKLYFEEMGMRDNVFCCRHLLLHRALGHKNGNHITNAVILKSICRRVGIQADILYHRKFMLLAVPSNKTTRKNDDADEPYECYYNVMTHDSFSPTKCREMAQRIGYDWRSIVNSARSSYDVLQLFVKSQLQLVAPFMERPHMLFQVRNTFMWRSILTTPESILDPPKVPYVACLDLAAQLDDGAEIV